MPRIIAEVDPKESLHITVRNRQNDEDVMTVWIALITPNHVNCDVTSNVGSSLVIKAWDQGQPLTTHHVNLTLEEHATKTVSVSSIRYDRDQI